ncbi:MAG: ion transporter [bacterium]|nr:ion transporter [bacterium]
MSRAEESAGTGWRRRLHEIIFEADTPVGKAFDIILLWAILLSVLAVMLESVPTIGQPYQRILRIVEWVFTVLFTLEYLLRLLTVRVAWRYAVSFYGLVDLLAIIPTYLSLALAGSHYFLVIRILRLLRVFRVFKLVRYTSEAQILLTALRASRPKITVFLGTVLTMVVVIGSLMYIIEGEEHGFTSIPKSIYWAIVTLTTVGYGDITPQTAFGQFLSALVMITGYGIIAVPTGIVSAELAQAMRAHPNTIENFTRSCTSCGGEGHDPDAVYCKHCAAALDSSASSET